MRVVFRPFAYAVTLAAAAGAMAAEPVTTRTFAPTAAATILGRTVHDPAGAQAGQLIDVLVGTDGKPIAGVVNIGGFLGVGVRKIAVAWRLLHVVPAADDVTIVMDLTLDDAAAAPEMAGPDNAVVVVDRPDR